MCYSDNSFKYYYSHILLENTIIQLLNLSSVQVLYIYTLGPTLKFFENNMFVVENKS